MKQITINLYSFNELSPETQKKVIEDNRNINLDHHWHDFIYDNWKKKLSSYGFIAPIIHFSGFYSQGDGACFDAAIDLETVLKQEDIPAEYKKLILAKDYIDFGIESNSSYYSHEHTRFIDWCLSDWNVDVRTQSNIILQSFCDWLESKRIDFCQRIYKDLQEEYEHLTSDEAIKETIVANNYTFEINGSMRNE